jgi:uncharacterized pyridoxamine 5'-phosphate oxidase family protein
MYLRKITGIVAAVLFTAAGCVSNKNIVPETSSATEVKDTGAFVKILREYPNGVLANRNGEKIRTQIITFQFAEGNRIYFCTNNEKPLYRQLLAHPYVSYCTYAEQYEPVLSLNGKVVFVEDRALKSRALEGSANVKRLYQTPDNPNFELFYIDVEEIETFDSEGAKIYRVN